MITGDQGGGGTAQPMAVVNITSNDETLDAIFKNIAYEAIVEVVQE